MKNRLIFIKLCLVTLATLALLNACKSGKGTSGLTVQISNSSLNIVPSGSSIKINGTTISPPYFLISQVSLTWQGPGAISIAAIEVRSKKQGNTSGSPGNSVNFVCGLGGDDLYAAFPSQAALSATVSGNKIVIIPSPTPSVGPLPVGSTMIGCSGIPVPSPFPDDPLNIPATMKVTAVLIPDLSNPNNTTGRVTATADITIH